MATDRISERMDVLGSDGVLVGTVSRVEGDQLWIVPAEGGDGRQHYLPLTAVDRVDDRVHLAMPAAGVAASPGAGGTPPSVAEAASLPPVRNRQVDGSTPRRNFYLPWIIGIVGLLLLLLLFRSCVTDRASDTVSAPAAGTAAMTDQAPATAALPVETVQLPNGRSVELAPQTLNYELQRYLASADAAPRTFTFDKLNFDTNAADVRAEDEANVDALAQILTAYPKARGRVVGYADARGATGANADLGKRRADAVVAALSAKGVAGSRIEAASGGEGNPADTNATPQGRFDNRRTELVVTAK